MRRMTSTRRGGFTLVELLVVIAILAVLATLATAAFFRVRGSSEVSSTEATLQKLKSGLDKRWKAVLDDASDDVSRERLPANVRDGLYRFAVNDKERVRVLWTYIKLKNEFPTTLAEACNPVMVPQADTSVPPGITYAVALPPKAVFVEAYRKQASAPPGATGFANNLAPSDPNYILLTALESAACFQWSLSSTATRGETFGIDGTGQQTGEVDPQLFTGTQLQNGGAPLKVKYTAPSGNGTATIPSLRTFKDAWGNPIVFVRQAYIPGETDKTPYTKAVAGKQDPIDPQGRLIPVSPTDPAGWDNGRLEEFWSTLNEAGARHWCYDYDPTPGAPIFPLPGGGKANKPQYPVFNSATRKYVATHWEPALISAGSNKSFELGKGSFAAGDDLFSFRLGRDSRGN